MIELEAEVVDELCLKWLLTVVLHKWDQLCHAFAMGLSRKRVHLVFKRY